MRSIRLVFVVLAALGACTCETSRPDGDPDPDGSTENDGSTASDGSTGDAAIDCTGGTLCGQPAMCCEAGTECVSGACLPACESGVRCGAASEVCCSAGALCIAGGCITPTTACEDSYDCEAGEFCEPTVDRCVAQPPGGPTCELQPTFSMLEPTIENSYTAHQILSIPVVANLDGVGAPEIVVNLTATEGGNTAWTNGNLVVLNGEDLSVQGALLAENAGANLWASHGRTTIAVGNVAGDDLPEIVYLGRQNGSGQSRVIAVSIDAAGTYTTRWRSFDGAAAATVATGSDGGAAVTLANFDDDAYAEVVVGGTLFDHDGRLLWSADAATFGCAGANCGQNDGYEGGISVVADLDADGHPEIISGRNAFKVVWTDGTPPSVTVTDFWRYSGNDGYPAVADLDGDGDPEVVLVASRQVIVLDGRTGQLWCGVDPDGSDCVANASLRTQPINIPGNASENRGGPPTIADFDGDGRPEIGVAGGQSYSLYDLNRPGEFIPPSVSPTPAAGATFVRWTRTTQDASSNATGSSVFDFQGDGAAEVVYADECFLRVYSGSDGALQLETRNTTATIHEYPLVVDSDGDGNSEILVVANDGNAAGNCGANVPTRRGLFVYGDTNDQWVPTRRVWTQHAYHVTNATSAGNVPLTELRNWEQPGLNNARQNVQGEGVFNAPDLAVSLSVGLDQCYVDSQQSHVLFARVTNRGSLGVPMGVPVYFESTDPVASLGVGHTAGPLLPGQSEILTLVVAAAQSHVDYRVSVDSDGTSGSDAVAECDESNNQGWVTRATCEFVLE